MDVWDYDRVLASAKAGQLDADDWRVVRRMARTGDVGAQFIMSFADYTPRTRKRWLQRAADQGHAEAAYDLYGMYPTDNTGGWLLKAAQAGSAEAQCALGCYFAWIPDHTNMRHWYLQAAVQGQPVAQYEVGLTLLTGEGGPADPEQGIAWLEKAAVADAYTASDARGVLGDVLESGHYGVAPDSKRAAFWRNFDHHASD